MTRKVLVPARVGFPLGVVLAVTATVVALATGAESHPAWSLLAMVIVVDVTAVLSTIRATSAVMVLCWGLHVSLVLGAPFTAQAGRDGLVLLLAGLSAVGFASLIRSAGQDVIPDIPRPREPMVFTKS